jgi:hypothetical protein
MRSFWRQKVPNSGVLTGFREVHFPSPLSMYHKGRYVTLSGRAGEQEKARFEKLFCAIFWAKILNT